MAWNDTPEGAALQAAFAQLQYSYNTTLPNHLASLAAASVRPISG